jgi:hypothetical protein
MRKPSILTSTRTSLGSQRVARSNRRGHLTVSTRLAAATVLAAAAAGSIGSTAQAVAVPTTPTVRVTLSGPVATIAVPIVSTTGEHGVHIVTVDCPAAACGFSDAILEDTPKERRSGVAIGTATGEIPSWLITPGATTWTVTDTTDGQGSTIRVEARRQASITRLTATRTTPATATVTGYSSSYNPAIQANSGSIRVRVQIQVRTPGGTWKPARTVTTDGLGYFHGTVPVPARGQVRAIRTEAVLSTAAESGPLTVV